MVPVDERAKVCNEGWAQRFAWACKRRSWACALIMCFLSYFWPEAGGTSARSSPQIIRAAMNARGDHARRGMVTDCRLLLTIWLLFAWLPFATIGGNESAGCAACFLGCRAPASATIATSPRAPLQGHKPRAHRRLLPEHRGRFVWISFVLCSLYSDKMQTFLTSRALSGSRRASEGSWLVAAVLF